MGSQTVRFGNRDIVFQVERSDGRKRTISIIVDPHEGVLVKSPKQTPQTIIDDIVFNKGAWILQKTKSHEEGKYIHSSKEFVTGESIQYMGRNYILRVIKNGLLRRAGFCRLKGKYLEAHMPLQHDAKMCWDTIKRWMFEKAEDKLKERVAFYSKQLSLKPGQIMIRDQRKRWASCDTKGNLRFNWQIIMAPLKLIDYVVVHELIHLKIHNHSPAYWKELERAMPDYQIRKEKLRLLGTHITHIDKQFSS